MYKATPRLRLLVQFPRGRCGVGGIEWIARTPDGLALAVPVLVALVTHRRATERARVCF
jgi:hypothetical protein